jgi:hypothetical protein
VLPSVHLDGEGAREVVPVQGDGDGKDIREQAAGQLLARCADHARVGGTDGLGSHRARQSARDATQAGSLKLEAAEIEQGGGGGMQAAREPAAAR